MRRDTTERLEKAASIYRNAGRDGRPPSKAVAHELGISDAAARALVRRARAAGLLPKTTQRRPTRPTHSPTTATVSSGPKAGSKLQICQTCLRPWPCPDWRQG